MKRTDASGTLILINFELSFLQSLKFLCKLLYTHQLQIERKLSVRKLIFTQLWQKYTNQSLSLKCPWKNIFIAIVFTEQSRVHCVLETQEYSKESCEPVCLKGGDNPGTGPQHP